MVETLEVVTGVTGIALAPLTKPTLVAALSPYLPANVSAQGVISLAAAIGGAAALYFGKGMDGANYLGYGLLGYSVGAALDAPTPNSVRPNVLQANAGPLPSMATARPTLVGSTAVI